MIQMYGLLCKGTYTAGLYVFVECTFCLQSLFQQNKTNVSFRKIACLIAKNPFQPSNYAGALAYILLYKYKIIYVTLKF